MKNNIILNYKMHNVNRIIKSMIEDKGGDRLCKAVELSMQCCEHFFRIHLRHMKLFKRSVNPEFEQLDVQNSYFGGGYVF